MRGSVLRNATSRSSFIAVAIHTAIDRGLLAVRVSSANYNFSPDTVGRGGSRHFSNVKLDGMSRHVHLRCKGRCNLAVRDTPNANARYVLHVPGRTVH